MILIRSVEKEDFKDVFELAKILNSYNLPEDIARIRELINISMQSFRGQIRDIEKRKFLFVAEDLEKKKVVGCSLIIASHGSRRLPHLSFQLQKENKKSRSLNLSVEHLTCKLIQDKRGYTEIGGLVLLPQYRGHAEKIGKQLSLVRFLFMARFPKFFQRRLLVEYLPAFGAHHKSPLWEALGQHFIPIPYEKADRLSASNKEFILSLFPKEKIYCSLLPQKVLDELANPGAGAQASLNNLKQIGFRFLNQIDPFDGGPHYGAKRKNITWIQKTQNLTFKNTFSLNQNSNTFGFVLAESHGAVRALATPFQKKGNDLFLPPRMSEILKVQKNEKVSFYPFGDLA